MRFRHSLELEIAWESAGTARRVAEERYLRVLSWFRQRSEMRP